MKQKYLYLFITLAVINVISFCLMWQSRTTIDYRAFYSAGRIALHSPASVYDADKQKAQLSNFTEGSGWLPYYHPVHELLIFAPLALIPYKLSLAIWTLMGVGFVYLSCRMLGALLALGFGMFATSFALFEGQDSLLLLFCLSSTLYLLQRDHDTEAGLVLALALFKPQIPLVVAIAMLVIGRRRFFASFSVSAALIGVVSLAILGGTGVTHLLGLVRFMEPIEQYWKMPTIRGLFSMVSVPMSVSAFACIALLTVYIQRWGKEKPLAYVFSSAVLVGSLTAFHFHAYDMAVLLIPASYLLSGEASNAELASLFALTASPAFFVLVTLNLVPLLVLPISVLAYSLKPELAQNPNFA